MKRIVSAVIVALIFFSVVEVAFVAHPVEASGDQTTLRMTTFEEVSVSENGTSQISILMNVSSPPLADMYRKVLAAPAGVEIEEEVPIPENATQEADASEDVTDILLPVREGFYESIVKEQLLSFGLRTKMTGSGMIPRGSANECRVMVNAVGSFETFKATNNGSNQMWEVGLGPFDTTGITGLVLTRLMFAQMMLGSISGDQTYQNYWHTRISLPAGTILFDQGLLNVWTIDFGGGTHLEASVSLSDAAEILMEEDVVITENNVTATPEYLAEALSTYRAIKIKYSLPYLSTIPTSNQQGSLNTNWAHNGDTGWVAFPDIPLPLHYVDSGGSSLDLRLTISPKLRVVDYTGWQFFYDWNFPFVHVDKFWALMNFSASIGLRLEVDATVIFYQNSWRLFYLSLRYATTFYGVPVLIYIDFTVDADLLVRGNMSFVAEATINGEIDTGVRWDHTRVKNGNFGWDGVYARLASANVTDFTWQLAVDISITPGLSFRIELLFYGVAGPFMEFDPYLNIEETLVYPNATILWEMRLDFDINAGVTLNGWLRNMLGLSDWSWVEYSQNLWHYNGSWNIEPQPSPQKPVHDLQVVSLKVSPPVMVANSSATVNVTIRNTGDYNETSEITLSENDSVSGPSKQINCTSGEDISISLDWDSKTLVPGSYVLKAFVTPVENEENTADNAMNTTVQIVANNDIAVFDLETKPNGTYVGRTVNITVVIENMGELTEDSNVTVNANDTIIGTRPISQLGANESIALVLYWNTSDLDAGQYVIWVNVTTLHYDINMANNNLTSEENVVELRILGDVDGSGNVDIYDAITAGNAFGSKPGSHNWNPFVDLNDDGSIDIFDCIMIGQNFGRTQS